MSMALNKSHGVEGKDRLKELSMALKFSGRKEKRISGEH